MNVSAPYRFVPLSRLILLPDWAAQVSHARPFADGLCGELQLRLSCHTSLCVGGNQDAATEGAIGRVHFFRTPEGRFAIPGSSLKGMIRNVLEIASFGRFRQVEDQRLGVRDISESKNFYSTWMVKNPSRAGWMRFERGEWRIRPCEFSRLHVDALREHYHINANQWRNAKTARQRYECGVDIERKIRFRRQEPQSPRQHYQAIPAVETAPDIKTGRIVVTGNPGKKNYEFVFHDEGGEKLLVSASVMAGFLQIHEGSDEWAFWRDKLSDGNLQMGIPVFYHMDDGKGDGGKVRSLGLAMMYKLPYKHSLHDAIRHTHAEHLGERSADLADLIFGHLGTGERGGLRGRVNIGFASVEGEPVPEWTPPCILNGPKPTFYPAYVRQDGKNGSFRQLMEDRSELAGWKRYPVKDDVDYPPIPLVERTNQQVSLKVQTELETLPVGTGFTCRLRFHNLRRVELGALLWALDFGGRNALRHGLGMGKPFGLGQLAITVGEARLRPNDAADSGTERPDLYLHACRAEFIDLMNDTLRAGGVNQAWEDCAPIKALLDYARPGAVDPRSLEYLPNPKAFGALKKADRLPELIETFHKHSGVPPSHGFDTAQPRGHVSRFADHFASAEARHEKEAKKEALAQLMSEQSPEDALLTEIEMLLAACTGADATKSAKDKLEKPLKAAFESKDSFDDTQQARLRQLAEQCQQIGHKAVQKVCKKILAHPTD